MGGGKGRGEAVGDGEKERGIGGEMGGDVGEKRGTLREIKGNDKEGKSGGITTEEKERKRLRRDNGEQTIMGG